MDELNPAIEVDLSSLDKEPSEQKKEPKPKVVCPICKKEYSKSGYSTHINKVHPDHVKIQDGSKIIPKAQEVRMPLPALSDEELATKKAKVRNKLQKDITSLPYFYGRLNGLRPEELNSSSVRVPTPYGDEIKSLSSLMSFPVEAAEPLANGLVELAPKYPILDVIIGEGKANPYVELAFGAFFTLQYFSMLKEFVFPAIPQLAMQKREIMAQQRQAQQEAQQEAKHEPEQNQDNVA